MAVTINGDTGITSVNGTAAAPSITGTDTDTGIVYGTNTLSLATAGVTALTINSSRNVTLTSTLTAAGLVTASNGLAVTGAATASSMQVGGIGTNLYPLVSGTPVVTISGTSVDFTGIPSWVKRITVMLSSVSTNGTSPYLIRIGTSGGFETTGYLGAVSYGGSGATTWYSSGFIAIQTNYAAVFHGGSIVLTHLGSGVWSQTGIISQNVTGAPYFGAGSKVLATSTLDRVRLTTVNGTDTFDAGYVNILYE